MIKMQGKNCYSSGGGVEKALLCDSGPELQLGRKEKRRAQIIYGMEILKTLKLREHTLCEETADILTLVRTFQVKVFNL